MAVETLQEAAHDLRIRIWPDCVCYVGTARQLQAEGLIPQGFEWPHAAADKKWEANGFDYWVCRERPLGHKGAKSSWLELDNWCLRVRVHGRDHHCITRRMLERKADELRAEIHRHTAAGSREWSAMWERYWQAREDKRFQAFKLLVPGLVPPRRGRKPKAGTP